MLSNNNILLKEIQSLKRENKKLLEKIEKNKNNNAERLKKKLTNESKNKINESISKMVTNILNNEEMNNIYIPDFIERKLYENILKILVSVLTEVLENTNIKILNQNITFNITPHE